MKRLLLLVFLLALGAWPQQPTVSYLAVRTRDGAVLAEQDSDRLLVPASSLKLLTAARALSMEPFQTTVWASEPLQGSVLHGSLILKGGGDPTLTRQNLAQLARMLHRQGLRRVEGPLEVDPGLDLGLPYGPGWAWEDAPESFQPLVCGLTVDGGLVRLEEAELAGLAIEREPGQVLTVLRLPGRRATLVRGPAPSELELTVVEPDLWAGKILRSALRDCEIEVGPVQRGRARGELLATHRSAPVREILRAALATSDNLVFEMLHRQLPAPEVAGRVVDGCGLSRYNLVTARTLVGLLLRQRELGDLLPAPGDPGTMSRRFADSPLKLAVRAKTGTLGGVSALAGVLYPGQENEVCFALLTNGCLDLKAAKIWEERFLETLAYQRGSSARMRVAPSSSRGGANR
ncbi:hypothetical protein DYH09_21665 [bacterium CPR1]|nr:hypothetical protein [bacterium CPR1]